jgi:DNA-binding LacI/PurR family transcriptional regulator
VNAHQDVQSRPPREIQIVESLERECSQAGINLLFLNFNIDDPDVRDKTARWFQDHTSIDGYILRPLSYRLGPHLAGLFRDLLLLLSTAGKPLAVLDELGLFSMPPSVASSRIARVFRIADYPAGQCVARALLALGHKRIAFITHYQDQLWVIRRFEGLRAEYAKAGLLDGVFQYSTRIDLVFLMQKILPTLSARSRSLPAELSRAIKKSGFPLDETPDLAGYFTAHKALIQSLHASAVAIAAAPAPRIDPWIRKVVLSRGEEAMLTSILRFLMGYLFEKASAEASVTAWVGTNDEAATSILGQLRRERSSVPRNISVIGFDNSPLAFEMGLASYDFNLPNIVRQMLTFIAHPLVTTGFAKQMYIEIPGFIIPRSSTAKARGIRAE